MRSRPPFSTEGASSFGVKAESMPNVSANFLSQSSDAGQPTAAAPPRRAQRDPEGCPHQTIDFFLWRKKCELELPQTQ